MLNPNESWTPVFVIFGLVCAVVGWGAIELLLWLFSFVHVSFGR